MSIAAACAARQRFIEAEKAYEDARSEYNAEVERCKGDTSGLTQRARQLYNVFVTDRTYSLKTVNERYIPDSGMKAWELSEILVEVMKMPAMQGVQVEVEEQRRDNRGAVNDKGDDLWHIVVHTWPGPAIKSANKTA